MFEFMIVHEMLQVEEETEQEQPAPHFEIDYENKDCNSVRYTDMQTQTERFTVDVATQTEIYTRHVETSTKTLWHRINTSKGTQSSGRECGSAKILSTRFPTPTKNNKERYYFPIYIIMFSYRIPVKLKSRPRAFFFSRHLYRVRRNLETRFCDN